MPQKSKYQLTDQASGKSYTVMLDHDPSDAEMEQIFNLKKQDEAAKKTIIKPISETLKDFFLDPSGRKLAEERRQAATDNPEPPDFNKLPVVKAGKDVINSFATPSNLAGIGLTAVAPEIGIPAMAGLTLKDAIPQAKETYQHPTLENVATSVRQALSLGLLGLGGAGLVKSRFGSNPKVSVVRPGQVSEGFGAKALEAKPIEQPASSIKPQAQLTEGTPTPQVKPPIVTPPPPGSIPESSVKGSTPKVVVQQTGQARGAGGRMLSRGKASGIRPVYTSESVETPSTSSTPSTPNTETPATTEEVKPQTELVKPGEIENKWINETETPVLKSLQSQAEGKIRNEIDSVLNSRGQLSETPETANPSKVQAYKEMVGNLINHGKAVGHSTLRDTAKAGIDAGLQHENIVSDITNNLHPEVTNPAGKAWNAVNKVVDPLSQ